MPRSGELHVIKVCSEYAGLAGQFSRSCLRTSKRSSSNTVIYAEAAGEASLDTDVTLDAGSGNAAAGHVVLDLASDEGVVTFSGGSGVLAGFQADADVTPDAEGNSHWDGHQLD